VRHVSCLALLSGPFIRPMNRGQRMQPHCHSMPFPLCPPALPLCFLSQPVQVPSNGSRLRPIGCIRFDVIGRDCLLAHSTSGPHKNRASDTFRALQGGVHFWQDTHTRPSARITGSVVFGPSVNYYAAKRSRMHGLQAMRRLPPRPTVWIRRTLKGHSATGALR
jgi:hypothetical protein